MTFDLVQKIDKDSACGDFYKHMGYLKFDDKEKLRNWNISAKLDHFEAGGLQLKDVKIPWKYGNIDSACGNAVKRTMNILWKKQWTYSETYNGNTVKILWNNCETAVNILKK